MIPSRSSRRVLSRHRLPPVYRISLTLLWLTPIAILALMLLIRWGAVMLDVRLFVAFGLMAIPAVYVWREGVDVLASGIIRRVHIPHYYSYGDLDTWYFDNHAGRRTLIVWDARSRKVLELRAGHLTGVHKLMDALKSNVRWRNWPY
jgi:hypothetical protein